MAIPKMTIWHFVDWPIMFPAINVHVSYGFRNYMIIKIFQGPPTCAILFDGPNQTGAYVVLPEGEHMCCEQPVMPLNDISESVLVTPATGSISIISLLKLINTIFD